MRKVAGSNRSLSMVALLMTGAVATTVACSTKDEEKNSAWECERVDVPMGEVTRCTAAARASETPSFGGAGGSATGAGSTQVRTYGAPPASDAGPAADPPAEPPSGSEAPAPTPDTPYECAPGSTSPDCPSGDLGTPPPPSADAPAGPDECSQVDDLPYCGGDAGGGATPPAGAPVWKCTKDMNGNKVCETAPSCAPGTHASECGACVLDNEPGECVPPSEGGCWVTGGGFIVEPSIVPGAPADGHDNYGGNAKQMKKGGVQGHWNHVDHGTKNHAKGRPEYLYCRHVDEPGPGQPGGKKGFTMNQVYFGGHAEWRTNDQWASGYWFDVVAKDHGEPGSQPSPKNGFMVDTYHFTIRKMDDPDAKVSGPVVYEVKGGLVGGNIQMHPPNNGHPGVQSPLPGWVALEP